MQGAPQGGTHKDRKDPMEHKERDKSVLHALFLHAFAQASQSQELSERATNSSYELP